MALEDILPQLYARAEKAAPLGKTLCFNMGDQYLYIDGTGASNIISFENKEADCLIMVSESDLEQLATGKMNPAVAVMTGKVKIKGDMGVAMKLGSLFS
jgi:putative sterol carrier protein